MEVYADGLFGALSGLDQGRFRFDQFTPVMASWNRVLPDAANLKMRVARYGGYPWQARQLRADLYHIVDHGYAHLLPWLEPARTVVTVHDTIPLLAGRGLIPGVPAGRRSWLNEYSLGFLPKAAAIVTPSSNTRRDLIHYCNCDPDRIHVLFNGIAPEYRKLPHDICQLRQTLGLPSEPGAMLVLITGNQFYKNHETCLRVLERLAQRWGKSLWLVRVGGQTQQWQQALAACPCRDQVICLAPIASALMPALYNAVDCLLFPSWYEGFGWPPLEAMACGTPVVVSNAASLPEVVGDAGLICAPDDVSGLCAAVSRVLEDEQFAKTLVDRGFDNIRRFSWQRYGERLVDIYGQVAAT